jgi:phosphatidylinositol-binding clathrin assembly protein
MSKVDATEAFSIYKQFIAQTDKVVDYLSVVRKLHNIVNVPVPNLKHAPTSLVKALEEYLNDPNFEENRREYKRSLGVVEGTSSARDPSPTRESLQYRVTSGIAYSRFFAAD